MVQKAYEQIKEQFERLKKPDGQKQSPAKTCRDLSIAHPDSKSGQYWIDPNEGDIRDAILVYCDLETEKKASCVLAQPRQSDYITYEGPDSDVWLGEISGGMKVYAQMGRRYASEIVSLIFFYLDDLQGRQQSIGISANFVKPCHAKRHVPL